MQNHTRENENSFMLDDESRCKFLHFHDSEKIDQTLSSNEQRKFLTSRPGLRDFLKANGFIQPEYLAGEDFAPLTAWAVKRNIFPIMLKSATNEANCHNIFMLKAFRELPAFYEEIRSENSFPIMIESYLTAKASIEVTFFNGDPILIAQVGLEKSMKLAHSWRVFPIKPPAKCLEAIKQTQEIFAELLREKNIPFRITYAFNPGQTIPLSINAGYNRLEYFEPWGNALHTRNEVQKNDGTVSKLLFYRAGTGQELNIDERELTSTLKATIKKIAVGKTTAILLQSDIPALLLEDSRKADSYFKHLKNEPEGTEED